MASGESGLVADLAAAILDGAPIDWPSIESSVDPEERALVEELKLLAGVADVHRASPAPGWRWAHLELREQLGAGAHGAVYRAWDERLDRDVALKLLPVPRDDAARGRAILEEGRRLARVRHPNVAIIHGADEAQGFVGLWMELVTGQTLEQRLDQAGAFPAKEAARVGVDICRAMSAVHEAGLLHRDVKAHNVMLSDAGRVVLMDFGTGRELDDLSLGRVAGTPLYLAPEIFRGAAASIQTDIYSAGVLLFRLATGRYPVNGTSVQDLDAAHRHGTRVSIVKLAPHLPAPLARVIDRAIDPDPARRFQSAAEMADALETARGARRHPVLAYVAAALLIGAGTWFMVGLVNLPGTPGAASAVAAGGAAGKTASRPAIAVLPLQNLSAAPDSEYFADGLTDEIIRNLAVIDGLDVRSRTSSFYFKDKPRNLRALGAELGVAYVVEGSVLRDGTRLRVNTQLVRVDDDVPLWSERFDTQVSGVFDVQEEISRAIVNRLRLAMGGRRKYETDVPLYDRYLKARELLERRTIGQGATEAVALFESIVAADPAFAPAHAGLATALAYVSQSPYQTAPGTDVAVRLRAAAARALNLDPLLPEAHSAMGWAHTRDFEWDEALRSYGRALELAPTLTATAINFSYSTLRALGRLDDAERLLRQALVYDPLSVDARRELAATLLQSGRYEEAIAEARRTGTDDEAARDLRLGRDLVRALVMAERFDEAAALAARPHSRFEERGARHWLARMYVRSGRTAEVVRMAAEEREFPFRLTFIQAALGNNAAALDALEAMRSSEPQRVALTMMQPELAMLRSDPRWQAIRRSLGISGGSPVDPRP
jgi:TolB-like protein/Tfp pilus assembly protein PilF